MSNNKADNKRTFAFLKDSNIFNGGRGRGGLKEWMTRNEQKRRYKDAERYPRKKNN